jgi:hypothetical protein
MERVRNLKSPKGGEGVRGNRGVPPTSFFKENYKNIINIYNADGIQKK